MRIAKIILGLTAFFSSMEFGSYLYLSAADEYELRVHEASNSGAVRGFGVKKNFSQTWTEDEFSVQVKTNNIGLREDRDFRGERVDIGFYGDSFTFGYGVESGERYSSQLRRFFPGKTILSFSYLNGWTTPHYHFFLKKNPALRPKIGVVGLYLANDLTYDIKSTAIRLDGRGHLVSVRSLDGKIDPRGFEIAKDINPLTLLIKMTWTGELAFRRIPHVLSRLGIKTVAPVKNYPGLAREFERGHFDAVNHIGLRYLLKMKNYLEARNSRLVVFLIPPNFYVNNYPSDFDLEISSTVAADKFPANLIVKHVPRTIMKHIFPYYLDTTTAADLREKQYLPKAILKWCRDNGVECVNPLPRFQELERRGARLYFDQDPHWNRAGHKAAAEVLADYLKERS